MPFREHEIDIDANDRAENQLILNISKSLRSALSNSLKINIGFLKSGVDSKRKVILFLDPNSLQSMIKVIQDTLRTIENIEKIISGNQFSTTITYLKEMRTSLYSNVHIICNVQRTKLMSKTVQKR